MTRKTTDQCLELLHVALTHLLTLPITAHGARLFHLASGPEVITRCDE